MARPYIPTSKDAEHRGLAALAAGVVQEPSALYALEGLLTDRTEITLYWNRNFTRISVEKLAENALKLLNQINSDSRFSE